jgi:transcriptional regulator with XRE-family HTH domain
LQLDAEALDYECGIRGVTFAELARRARIRPATISNLRNGRHQPRPATVAKLSIALGRIPHLPPEDLRLLKRPATVAEARE